MISPHQDWFWELTGLTDDSPSNVRDNILLRNGQLICTANGRQIDPGQLSTPTLGALRNLTDLKGTAVPTSVEQIVADVQDLHRDPENSGATFQVASQFNLLEMASPEISPEDGIARYAFDHTQGPACAIACGAGTLYRNYFVPFGEVTGQNRAQQIDTLSDLGSVLGNVDESLWKMRNGYALPTNDGLERIAERLAAGPVESFRQHVRVGIQGDTDVTLEGCDHKVTQIYASALPVAYTQLSQTDFEPFAQLILNAAYEATFHAALLNAYITGNHRLYLTQLGGGAFGNRPEWIMRAIERSLDMFSQCGLKVVIVSYGQMSRSVTELLERRR